MEDSPNSECQDGDAVDNESDDPVEECSDVEEPPQAPAPRTPTGVVGRFASLLGAQRSGGKLASRLSDEGGDDDIIGATQHPRNNAQEGAGDDDATLPADLRLTQDLEAVMGSLPTNLEDLLSTPDEKCAAVAGAAGPDPDGPQLLDDGTLTTSILPGLFPQDEASEDVMGRATVAEPFLGELPEEGTAAGAPSAAADASDPGAAKGDSPDAAAAAGGAAPGPQDVESDESDAEGPAAQEALPDEPWMSYPAHEQELWERVRPRAVRREALRLQSLRLPAAAVSRLMRLNPALQVRSAEALELVNYATLLMVQAVARAAARGKAPGQRVQFEDVRLACSGARELEFMQPLHCTLDASARVMRKDEGAAAEAADLGAKGVFGAAGRQRASAPVEKAAEPDDGADEGGGSDGDATPLPRPAAGADGTSRGSKRKAAASAQKTPSKAARAASGGRAKAEAAAVGAGPGIAAFFKRVGAA